MLNSKIKFVQRVVMIIDLLMVIDAYFMSFAIRNIYFSNKYHLMTNFNNYLWVLAVITVTWPVCFFTVGSYKFFKKKESILTTLLKPVIGNAMAFALLAGLLFFMHDTSLSRLFLIIFLIVTTILLPIVRVAIKIFMLFLSKRYNKFLDSKNILIIGTGCVGKSYCKSMKKYKVWGSNVIGFLENITDYSPNQDSIKILGEVKDLESVVSRYNVNEVVIALPIEDYGLISGIIDICDKEGVRTNILPVYTEDICATVEEIDGMPMIHVREVPLDYMYNRFLKRSFDIAVSLLMIIVFMPIMAFVAFGVKLSSKGPILYKQERVGVWNRPFMMYKFRSMRIQDKKEEKLQWTTSDDPRKTAFGSFIRKTSLDELPQLFNVLLGNMSIIGPRPERPYWVDKFKEEVPQYMMRHYIKSGITGWAQINGWRGDSSIEERIKCDNYYIRNWSFLMDVKIMFLTLFKGFVNSNAY